MSLILSKVEQDELKHIYNDQPVHDGDTLSGTTRRSLRRMGLIQTMEGYNYTTPKGNEVYHQIKSNPYNR